MLIVMFYLPDTCSMANKGLCLINNANDLVDLAATFNGFDKPKIIGSHGWIITNILLIGKAEIDYDLQEGK